MGETIDHGSLVHNFMAHIDRCAIMLKRARKRRDWARIIPLAVIEHFSFHYRNLEGT